MRERLAAARNENAPVLDEASSLLAQRRDYDTKKQLLGTFQDHFIIPEQDLRHLTTNVDSIDEDFFRVLARVKQIHQDCQVLLGTENQRLGLELMDASSRQLNSAYQKLYRWIQGEYKTVNFENPQISSIIRRALRALAERPALFQSCLDFFAEARQHALLDAFYAALTGSSDKKELSQATKPIDFHAHDSLRYIGDMLAWTHSAAVSEKEALEGLATADGDEIAKGIKYGTENQPISMIDGEALDGRKALEQLAGRNLTGVMRTLRQRVEQVIHSVEEPLLTYRILNLVGFYHITFDKLLGADCDVGAMTAALESMTMDHFRNLMHEQASSVKADLQQPPRDLQVPHFLDTALSQLRALMKNFQSSLTPGVTREDDFKSILSLALEPFLEFCKQTVTTAEEPARSIFLINCLHATTRVLCEQDFVQPKMSEVQEDLAQCTSSLIEFQHAFFLHRSGLHPLVAALAPLSDEPSGKMSSITSLPQLQPAALRNASQTLDEFLPSALMDATENLRHLSNKEIVGEITAEGAERFCEDFEFVEDKLGAADEEIMNDEKPLNKSPNLEEKPALLRSLFPRTSGEIRVLLS